MRAEVLDCNPDEPEPTSEYGHREVEHQVQASVGRVVSVGHQRFPFKRGGSENRGRRRVRHSCRSGRGHEASHEVELDLCETGS